QPGPVRAAVPHGIARAHHHLIAGQPPAVVLDHAEDAAHGLQALPLRATPPLASAACTANDRRVAASWSAREIGQAPPLRSAVASASSSSRWPLLAACALQRGPLRPLALSER